MAIEQYITQKQAIEDYGITRYKLRQLIRSGQVATYRNKRDSRSQLVFIPEIEQAIKDDVPEREPPKTRKKVVTA